MSGNAVHIPLQWWREAIARFRKAFGACSCGVGAIAIP